MDHDLHHSDLHLEAQDVPGGVQEELVQPFPTRLPAGHTVVSAQWHEPPQRFHLPPDRHHALPRRCRPWAFAAGSLVSLLSRLHERRRRPFQFEAPCGRRCSSAGNGIAETLSSHLAGGNEEASFSFPGRDEYVGASAVDNVRRSNSARLREQGLMLI